MLKRLQISNYLLIEKTEIIFQAGFNVLIGESGAGKSLIVNILCLPLAKSVGPDVIGRWGAEAVIGIEFDDDLAHVANVARRSSLSRSRAWQWQFPLGSLADANREA